MTGHDYAASAEGGREGARGGRGGREGGREGREGGRDAGKKGSLLVLTYDGTCTVHVLNER